MSSAAATACTRTPRCRLRRTAASLNSALYSWTFFGPARGTRHLPLLGGSVYKSEAGSPGSFKRLLGVRLPMAEADARTHKFLDCRVMMREHLRLRKEPNMGGLRTEQEEWQLGPAKCHGAQCPCARTSLTSLVQLIPAPTYARALPGPNNRRTATLARHCC